MKIYSDVVERVLLSQKAPKFHSTVTFINIKKLQQKSCAIFSDLIILVVMFTLYI